MGTRAELRRHDIFLRKLLSHSLLSDEDQDAIAALPHSYRHLEPNEYILREGDRSDTCPILWSGFAYRQKATEEGGRQIVALKIPGDPMDFQSMYVRTTDHNLQALTAVDLIVFALSDFERLIHTRPAIARAVIVDILIEASIGREWLLNMGRRNALARLAHLLCELHYRLLDTRTDGLDVSDVPMTQEQLADLLGLTPVHINRTLKELERRGAIARNGRRVRIGNLAQLRALADFTDTYLHRHNHAG
ncbi:MAG: Crp/Fnr family transcriptional regulator [Sphingomonadales bacterium]|nr:Crp/Fnr family transcriptional regulator [Sphingomonadales bacterium]